MRKEAELIANKILADNKRDIENLEKHHKDLLTTEERKMVNRCVKSLLEAELTSKTFVETTEDFISIIEKKVA
jgi:hypothetical protein